MDASAPLASSGIQSPYITILQLNRPQQANALSLPLLRRLEEELLVADAHYPDCRAVILAASGTRAFSAGHDLPELRGYLALRRKVDDNQKDADPAAAARAAAIRTLFDTCRRVMLC